MKEKTYDYLIKASAIVIAAFFLTSIFSASSIGLTRIENASKKNDVSKEIISNFADKLIIDYFKVREYPSGSWHTSSITANLGAELEFKLKVKSTRIFGHEFVFVIIDLPTIGDDPMFDYVEGSASNPGNLVSANDEELVWFYLHIGPATPRVMSFRAIIVKPGSEPVDLTVFSMNPDTSGDPSTGSIQVTGTNQPPSTPSTPSGPTSGYICEYYEYSTSASDPEGHSVRYYFNWGDGTGDLTEWVNSGEAASCSHRWDNPGTYYVKTKAQDEYYAESSWSDTLPVNIVNHPPNVPSNPSPDDGETDVDVNANLSWVGGDPDSCDYVVYDVYFEADDPTPDELVSDDQIDTSYDPGTMQEGTTYYWQIIAKDNHDATTSGPIWHFTTPNNPPYPPSNPNPANGSTDVDIDADLSWNCSDSDGDPLTYDVYFNTNTIPTQVAWNQSGTTYDPGTMEYDTTYYWKIVAWDNHDASTAGPIWEFTTVSENISVNIPLSVGWNLITIPVNNSWYASDIVANVTDCANVVKWDPIAQSYWFYIPGFPAFDFPLENGVGYFVDMNTADTLSVSGKPIEEVNVQLNLGWNLLGWYHEEDTSASSLAENISGCNNVVKWDPVAQSYWFYIPGFPAFDFTVTCGMGVFVEVSSTSIWHGEG